ncbi:MAG TPA: hypothetical protein VFK41_09585 [Nocardioidaceae bacterium]|nr:hypothetical protein [Nocardioidaceae bacterium]
MGRLATAVVIAALLAACTEDPRSTTKRPTGPDAAEQVETVVVTTQDLPRGVEVELIPQGDVVEGQTTLDECGQEFPSEADRVARRQVTIAYPGDDGSYSHEVVAYGTNEQALAALHEWRAAVRSCPEDRFVAPREPGFPPVRTQLLELHAMSVLAVPDNSVARQVLTTEKGESVHVAAIYQRYGRVLSASYLLTSGPPTRRQVDRLTEQASSAGERLLTLPGGEPA